MSLNHSVTHLVATVRSALAQAANPERAAAQQRYMKSQMPFRGITSPELSVLVRPLLNEFGPTTPQDWQHCIVELWDNATHREERYAALAVARMTRAQKWCDPNALPMFRHLIVTGAWWDFVDVIAAHLVGRALQQHRFEITPVMREWSLADDLWIRRTAVLSQLRHKSETDRELLRDVIENNLEDTSFWLRKSMGWALREFARTDDQWVQNEVDAWGPRLSNLSTREALKHLRSQD